MSQLFSGKARPRQMVDIQQNITVMSGREVSRPYRVFRRRRAVYPFGDATALAGEGDVGDVVWLI